MRIRAAVTLSAGAEFTVGDVDLAEVGRGEVLVEVRAAGICPTDLAARDAAFGVPFPAILGHEAAGVVAEIGSDVTRVQVGDHVVLSYDSCGACRSCVTARPFYCDEFAERNFRRTRPDGSAWLHQHGQLINCFGQAGFATMVLATERMVVRLDPEFPLELAAGLSCGVQTGAGAVLNTLRPEPGDSIAIYGTGTVGLAAVMAARAAGVERIIAIDRVPARLEVATAPGATDVVHAPSVPVADQVRELTGGRGTDKSVETTGLPSVLSSALQATAAHGEVGFVGTPKPGANAEFPLRDLLAGGRSVRGIISGESVPQQFLPYLVALWTRGALPVERIVTIYELDEINRAVHDLEAAVTIKPVLTFT